jgi:transposase
MTLQRTILDYTGQHVYVGLDVHKKSWTVSLCTEQAAFKTFTQPPEVETLMAYVRRTFPHAKYHCVYEAGFCGYWIVAQLRSSGIECLVINPADVPTSDKEKQYKTNRVDARKLVRSLRNGELAGIYVPSRTAQEDRALVRSRHTLVGKQTRCKNLIKSTLCFYGIALPEDIVDRYWSARFTRWLESLELATTSGTTTLKMLLEELAFLRQLILRTTRAIRSLACSERYVPSVEHLTSIPGVSILVAMIFLTEIVDIERFRTLDHLASFVGLVPGERSSGEEKTDPGITHRKNPHLRWVLMESAWVAIRHDPSLALAFTKLAARMPKTQAIVRIARKLLNRIRFTLKQQQDYMMPQAA